MRFQRGLAPGIVFLLAAALCLSASEIEGFRLFDEPGYVHTNAVHFSPDGNSLYLALFPERVAEERGVPASADAPEVSIYVSSREGAGWSAPEPISFASAYKDYEPTLSPDGKLMLFNSWRPMPDGTPVTNEKNNLWLSRLASGGWTEPVILGGVSKLETEESYAAIGPEGRVYYGQETLRPDGVTVDYDIYTGRLVGDRLVGVAPFLPAATGAGEGDPWVSADGDTLVFTHWELGGDWYDTVDLYVMFRRDEGWTTPVPMPVNDPAGPDFSPAASADGKTFYWKQSDGTKMMPMESLLSPTR